MTLLLIDIGNTRIKWARLSAGRMGKQQAAAHIGWDAATYARRVLQPPADRVVVSSVAGSEVDARLRAGTRLLGTARPEFVTSQRRAAGVSTRYLEPWRLGVDRFVAAIGAHHLAAGKPVCVVSLGTAMTIDLIDAGGVHRGGAIVPGPDLMVESLLSRTSGIRRRAQGGARGPRGLFARTTRSAVAQGARYAAAAIIDRSIEIARAELRSFPLLLLTGGRSDSIRPLLQAPSVRVPDLVLHGLAVWAAHVSPATRLSAASAPRRASRRQAS